MDAECGRLPTPFRQQSVLIPFFRFGMNRNWFFFLLFLHFSVDPKMAQVQKKVDKTADLEVGWRPAGRVEIWDKVVHEIFWVVCLNDVLVDRRRDWLCFFSCFFSCIVGRMLTN